MSFWDSVKNLAKPYGDDEYDDYDDEEELDEFEEEEAPAPRTRRSPRFHTPASEPAEEYSTPSSSPAASPAASTPSSPASGGFSGQVVNMHNKKQEVVLFHAKVFDDSAKGADELCNKRAVILNMENVDKALTRRVVDFLSGCVYAMKGDVKKIAQSTYLFCPQSMEILGDLETIQNDVETYI